MSDLTYKEAFAKFGATLRNPQWSVCAVAQDSALIVSCWNHLFKKPEGRIIRYIDSLSRWAGPGNNELRERLSHAFLTGQVIRPVIVRTEDTAAVKSGADLSGIKKWYSVKEHWMGRVVEFDEYEFTIEFADTTRIS